MAEVHGIDGQQEQAIMQAQEELYYDLVSALSECALKGISLASMKTLFFVTGADISDVISMLSQEGRK